MPQHILVPLDGSILAETAVPHAAALTRAFDAKLTLARVPESMIVPVASGGVWMTREVESGEAKDRALSYLENVAARDILSDREVALILPEPPAAAGLLDAIEALDVDLVVLSTHGRSAAGRWVFGSVAQKLINHATAQTYVVRPPKPVFERLRARRELGDDGARSGDDAPRPEVPAPEYRRVLVPLDGSELAESALPTAESLASHTGASIHLVRIPTIPGYAKIVPETSGMIPDLLNEQTLEAEAYLTEVVDRLEANHLDAAATVEIVVQGDVARGLLDHADAVDADVIVISTHGRSGVGRWVLGSVADRLLRGATRPVWVIRPGQAEPSD